MFDGWFTFGGAEIINRSRVQAYIENMLPNLKTFHVCNGECHCETLAALLDDNDYTTPMIDDAPWADSDRMESYDFLGVYPLGVTGVNDSTVGATIVEGIDDGGWITSRRRGTREMRFSVATFAMSDAAANYGTQWLKSVLDGGCASGCEARDQLCFLTECADPSMFGGVQRQQTHRLTDWTLFRSAWADQATVSLREQSSFAELEVRGSCGDIEWELELQGTAGDQFLLVQDDREDMYRFDGSVQTFRATTGGSALRLAVPDVTGLAEWGIPDPLVEDETLYAHHTDTGPTIGSSTAHTWEHVTTIPLRIKIVKVVSNARFELSQSECAEEFYRFIRRVGNTEGPRVRQTLYPSGGGVITYLDFILTSESPWLYGTTVEAAAGSSSGIFATAQPYRVVRLTANVPECLDSPQAGPLVDPLGPVTPPPPRVNIAPSTIRTGYQFSPASRPYALIIPAETVPQWLSVVPIVSLTAGDEDVRFVSVRFFPMPFDSIAVTDIDPCSQCGSFEVAYIPKGATFTVDATEERATVDQGGIERNAQHLVTAPGGVGTVTWPALSCGVSYMVIIDSNNQALSHISIDLAVRE